MVLNLVELIQRQFEPNDIVTRIKHLLEQSAFYFTTAKLDNLVKGGRVNPLSGLLSNALEIIPIITMSAESDGEVSVPDEIRTKKRAQDRLFEIADAHIQQYPKYAYVAVGHTGGEANALVMRNRI